jgi:hypothetical protein
VFVAPACVIVTFWLSEQPLTVRFAVRGWVLLFSWYCTVTVALPLPELGVTVIHEGTPVIVQLLQLLITEKLVLPALTPTFSVGGLTVRVFVAPACVIVTFWLSEQPLTVRFAVRGWVLLFSWYCTITVALPLPELGVTVIHEGIPVMVQLEQVEVILKDVLPEFASTLIFGGLTVSVAPLCTKEALDVAFPAVAVIVAVLGF